MHLIPVSRGDEGGPTNPGITKNLPSTASLTTDDFALQVKSNVNSDILGMTNLIGTLFSYLVSTTVRIARLFGLFFQIDKIDSN